MLGIIEGRCAALDRVLFLFYFILVQRFFDRIFVCPLTCELFNRVRFIFKRYRVDVKYGAECKLLN